MISLHKQILILPWFLFFILNKTHLFCSIKLHCSYVIILYNNSLWRHKWQKFTFFFSCKLHFFRNCSNISEALSKNHKNTTSTTSESWCTTVKCCIACPKNNNIPIELRQLWFAGTHAWWDIKTLNFWKFLRKNYIFKIK